MLPRYQPDPGSEATARRECPPISDFGNQGGSNDRADSGDFFQPPAFFARSVAGMDVLLDVSDLGRESGILPSKDIEAQARCRWDTIVLRVGNDLEQLRCTIAALGRDDAELRQMSSDR